MRHIVHIIDRSGQVKFRHGDLLLPEKRRIEL
jgi:hypothetical protein